MSNQRNPNDVMLALLEWTGDEEMSDFDVAEELAAAKVDVPAFLARVHNRVKAVQETQRLAWRETARAKIAATQRGAAGARYANLDRTALLAKLTARQQRDASTSAITQAFFHEYDQQTDDDLRTLLEDQDAVNENGED